MSDDPIAELRGYRMEQARETLREAELLLAAQSWRGTVNRSYYAMFYAVLALLAGGPWRTAKHAGVIAVFDREFVRTGTFPSSMSRSLHVAFDLRQTHDYGETLLPDPLTTANLVSEASGFVAEVARHLRDPDSHSEIATRS